LFNSHHPNRVNPILCDTPEKANEEFEVIAKYEDDSISLYEISLDEI